MALLAFGAWFLMRRERQKRLDKTFDGNFDPDRTSTRPPSTLYNAYNDKLVRKNGVAGGTLPNVGVNVNDEGDDGMGGRLNGTSIGGGVVTPFVLGQQAHQHGPGQHPYGGSQQQQMQQYYNAVPGSPPPPSQYGGTSETGGYSSTTASYYPAAHQNMPNPYPATHQSMHNPHDYPAALMPGMMQHNGRPPSPTATGSTSTATNPTSLTSTRIAKEREALGQAASGGGGFALANPDAPSSSARPASANRNSVVVHQDAGRIPEEERADPSEIPPTYDSIPRS